jgi:hypothetical protein
LLNVIGCLSDLTIQPVAAEIPKQKHSMAWWAAGTSEQGEARHDHAP